MTKELVEKLNLLVDDVDEISDSLQGNIDITSEVGSGVQASIDGLADAVADIAALTTALNSHITNATDAHDASAISVLDAANKYTATNVEAALAEAYFRYIHTQSSPAATWTITHNLVGYPQVTVVDSGGTQVEGDVDYTDTNELTVAFSGAFSGVAYLS